MKKIALIAGAAVLPFALPAVAHAQEATSTAHPYIGVQVGIHNLGIDEDEVDTAGFDLDDAGKVYGVYGGVDFDIGSTAIIGVEGNANLGDGPIDAEYGVAGRIGVKTGDKGVIFVRAGYQWINVSAAGLLNVDKDLIDDDDLDLDDTIGDYLVGVGADVNIGPNIGVRVAMDTVSFDTVRPSVGLHFRF
jgi:hypothetical protein